MVNQTIYHFVHFDQYITSTLCPIIFQYPCITVNSYNFAGKNFFLNFHQICLLYSLKGYIRSTVKNTYFKDTKFV